ncbi:MAG: alpha/beta fold hydrolase [Halorhodospira sp.]
MARTRKIWKRLGIAAGGLLLLGILAAAAGPFLIDPEPAEGAADGQALAGADSRFATVPFPGVEDGLQLHYIRAGEAHADAEAPTWILLHGFSFSTATWRPLLPRLAAERDTIAYDQIPYGLSEKPVHDGEGPNPFTLEANVDRLLALMDELGRERAVLVGNSSGAVIALEAARRAPERVAGVVLINPMVGLERPTFPAWLAGLPQVERLSLLAARWLGDSTALLERSYHDPEAITPEREAQMRRATQMAGWDRAWGQLIQRSVSEALAVRGPIEAIDTPAQVIVGTADEVIPPADSRHVAEVLPNAELAEIEACGHVPQEECPAEVAAAIAQWRQEHGL